MSSDSLTRLSNFSALKQHAQQAQAWTLRDLFAQDTRRGNNLQVEVAGIYLDYSKNPVNNDTISLLCALAQERGIESKRDAMFSGKHINNTENRAVLHTALRAPLGQALHVDEQDINHDVHQVLAHMRNFSERVRKGEWRGYQGEVIRDVVNIGIGGSDLGPKMVVEALKDYGHEGPRIHFVANVDGHDLQSTLRGLNPATTLFIIASKTFTTAETMMNAQSAREWFLYSGSASDLPKHFVAVSTNAEAVTKFGIDTANMFGFWDWVGGRYSIWSAIGLPVMLAIGAERHAEFLAGAHQMDEHFKRAPLSQNMPVLLAMLGVWQRNFLGNASLTIAPYHHYLSRFPDYLQQLEMESNGKRVTHEGHAVDYATCPTIWGNVGTNAQHAYFQLLHQGSDVIPVDFIAVAKASHALPGHQEALLANCFAQSEAFMRGKNEDEVRQELQQAGLNATDIARLMPHKVFPGNRPSNTLLLEALTPATLGALIALYEHKVFVQGVIWDVNSFDQWGVELGKVLARNLQTEIHGEAQASAHDSSTNALVKRARIALGKTE